ncbi:alpha/beta hydrolase [Natronospira bacteriovora]|uniref:Alpha/beta-hydrolase family protein n=1 Tax=Natronospira bacteriovora TaxID=3069753 RepID=A0ABU0W6I0_9GAMM|nr:alpha/beta-hydrolase family protein [Natronospira sp. AB-CW4]MDQ2068610.1 alpha/beta-hydrolase family protein [Natronospira sp. AB-CW4]
MRIGLLAWFSTTGLLLGTFFFALSLTPSLVPRSETVQGLISGLSLAAGYGIGVAADALWRFMHLPTPRKHLRFYLQLTAGLLCGLTAVIFLWQADRWQNALRALMEMEPTSGMRSLVIALIAVLVFLFVFLLAHGFRRTFLFLSRKLERFISPHSAHLIGLAMAFALFWALVDGILFSAALRSADTTHQQLDALMEAEHEAPLDPALAGSPASLLAWEDMGRQGRRYLAGTPEPADIQAVTGEDAQRPIRVYVGLNAGDSPEERAELALQELIRVGGFDRSTLLLITPTGTGWVDPAGVEPVEYMLGGDVASVAAQYSYLPSPISLMAEGAYGAESARALFQAVYGHWTELAPTSRPDLYLFGLSLGALNSDRSFDFYDIINDPFQGALWSGPPFRSDTWRDATRRRHPDSPAWLPRFRDDAVIRFANQQGGLEQGARPWGNFRIAFLQYASDPITFFSPDIMFREPDWMQSRRGPDVSKDLRWFPVVTMLQLAADMAAGSAPTGYGHEIAARDYLDAWMALMEPGHLNEALARRLRNHFGDR